LRQRRSKLSDEVALALVADAWSWSYR